MLSNDIFIHNLETFLKVSERNIHSKSPTPKTKKTKWPPFSEYQVWFLKYDHIPDNSNSSILLYSYMHKVPSDLILNLVFKISQIRCKKNGINIDASFHMTLKKIVCTAGVCFFLKFSGVWSTQKKINSMNWWTMCSLVTNTVQLNTSLHVYFISDKIVLKCVKTHDSRILSAGVYTLYTPGCRCDGCFYLHLPGFTVLYKVNTIWRRCQPLAWKKKKFLT